MGVSATLRKPHQNQRCFVCSAAETHQKSSLLENQHLNLCCGIHRDSIIKRGKMRMTKANKEMEARGIKDKWDHTLEVQPDFTDQAKNWSASQYGGKAINWDGKKTEVLRAFFYGKLSTLFPQHFTSATCLNNHSSPSNQNVLLAHLSPAVTSQTCWIWNWF